jgi:1,4-alpha-glucan branching enzyme
MILSNKELESLLQAANSKPHDILGMHPCTLNGTRCLVVRAFIRDALSCDVVDIANSVNFPLQRIAKEGLFEGIIEKSATPFTYQLRVIRANGEIVQFYDPYSFLPTLGEQDLYLFNEGNEHRIYTKLGSHIRTINGVIGVSFAVWAPSAHRVSVVGEFNHWDGRYHPMRTLGSSGVWEIFIPGLSEGVKYKFELIGKDGYLRLKTDPYATYFESPPHNASIVRNVEAFAWTDDKWIEKRAKSNWHKQPISVYEVHMGSWKRVVEDGNRPLSYVEAAQELVAYVKEMGYTHVEFMPLAEHPFTGSWGYQVTGFYAPTHRYGTPEEFQMLVNTFHENDIGVILDWVPGHFPMDSFALADFDGSHLYEHADPRQGFHQDWGTYIFNYGRHEVRCFLVANALFWMDRYHIDGLRVDAVASMLYLDYSRKDGEWVPNKYGGNENLEAIDFLRNANALVHKYYPGALMIAEESTAFGGVSKPVSEGGLGFDFKWNMGWMNDSLKYFEKDPFFRKWHHNHLTFGMVYQYSENFFQVYSHDEVVHGKGSMIAKMSADGMTAKAATLRALYALMWSWPGKKTLFMGSDFGQSSEWHYDNSLDWHLLQYKDHCGVKMIVHDLNHLYRQENAFHSLDCDPSGFEWVSLDDSESSVIAYLRKGSVPDEVFLIVGHYTPVVRRGYRLGVPFDGYWKEILNSDSDYYGGTGTGNLGGVYASNIDAHGQRYSVELTLPGNSTLIFKFLKNGPSER